MAGAVVPRTDDELIARLIEPNPHQPGLADARTVDFKVSVAALIAYMTAVDGDIDRVAHDYAIPLETVEAAIAYYRRHQDAIDQRIAEDAA